jgi:uncharacterized membrane protein
MSLLASPEGRILITGVVAAAIYWVWLFVELATSPKEGQLLVTMTVIDIFAGRAAAMAFGFAAGFDKGLVIFVCTAIETVLVLLVYPLFVLAFQNLLVIKWLNKAFIATRAAAEKQKDRVERYGFIGLFVFVWIPFWMTGPVVGCVIGYLIGMKTWVNMVAVIAGTCIAITCWALFLQEIYESVAAHSPWAATALMLSLIVVIVLANVLKRAIHNRKNHEQS